jgi:hypothetical protein
LPDPFGAHDGVDLARIDGQADPLEDRLAIDGGVQVFNSEHS